jgi:hypothetical protein
VRGGIVALIVVSVLGLTAWAIVDFENWKHRCREAGGAVEERYEGTDMVITYTYDAKGNVTGYYYTPTDRYSYHCWLNGQEIQP